jgi:hypothetical protein
LIDGRSTTDRRPRLLPVLSSGRDAELSPRWYTQGHVGSATLLVILVITISYIIGSGAAALARALKYPGVKPSPRSRTTVMNRIAQSGRLVSGARTLLMVLVFGLTLAGCIDATGLGARDTDLEIIWPRPEATLIDEEYLQVRLRGWDLDEYEVYWYVDDSREELMWNEWEDHPEHKGYVVDTWFWDWRGEGPYTVGFIAEDVRGRRLAERTVRVYVR